MQKLLSLIALLTAAMLLTMTRGPVGAAKVVATQAANQMGTNIPGSGLISGPAEGEAKRLNASGATFPLELYNKWIGVYKSLTGVEINYAGGGSGQGKKDISSQAVDFAGSDSFLKDEELKNAQGGELVHIATTIGGIVPVYNIPEVKEPLKFTGDTLAQIYLGTITQWNDPTLVADNPSLKNVAQDILPVYRSDGSGTTNNFTLFLTESNRDWADQVKSGTTVKWPVGRGANGNPGVANEVSQVPYSIGYVELAFAKKLQSGLVKNPSGKFVAANAESISAAASGLYLPDDLRIALVGKSNAENAYPISTFTWLLVYTNQTDSAKGLALAHYLWWCTHDGQQYAADLGYAPLTLDAIALDEINILKITIDGKPALPANFATAGVSATMVETPEATAAK